MRDCIVEVKGKRWWIRGLTAARLSAAFGASGISKSGAGGWSREWPAWAYLSIILSTRMGLVFPLTASVLTFILLLSLYVYTNDRKLTQIPPRALAFSPSRFSTEDARLAARKYADSPLSVHDQLPRKTGRRYIVVGGVNRTPDFMQRSSRLTCDP